MAPQHNKGTRKKPDMQVYSPDEMEQILDGQRPHQSLTKQTLEIAEKQRGTLNN